ncbi:DUF6445 family protein [Erythrobacter insulae]|uniref:DUF6445 family protein n=1 Tax=Erythrobacter insulae TaxID=2584124 RepID=UPI00115C9238|nr:DUF6445 family protein [Erythrobacter insulae]
MTVQKIGKEGAPLVIIDGMSGRIDDLKAAGFDAAYEHPGAGYPGIRAWASPEYLDIRRDLMMQIVGRIFGISHGIQCEMSCFSLVTTPPADLVPLQRIPHYDRASTGRVIGVMHYLLGSETGGTAFYRQKRTGFEVITDDRVTPYLNAIEADTREFGPPPAEYYYGDSDRYELIGEVEAQPDRMILYPGRLLHSGVIAQPDQLSSDPKEGRLTINMFLVGT